MILILKLIESMISKYPCFDYEFGDMFLDITILVVLKVIIDFIIWL